MISAARWRGRPEMTSAFYSTACFNLLTLLYITFHSEVIQYFSFRLKLPIGCTKYLRIIVNFRL